MGARELKTDICIVGGGTGGVAAAIAGAALGRKVILTEPTNWIGGQLTSQAIPPDENPWIERGHGATARYLDYRNRVRDYYRKNRPLTDAAKVDLHLNPGGGFVSRLCHEPRVAWAVLQSMVAPFVGSGVMQILTQTTPLRADVDGDRVRSIMLHDAKNNEAITIQADFFLDATELGDLLPLTKAEYVVGAESQAQTGEPHATPVAQPGNVQAFTWCLAVGFDPTPHANHVIDKPAQYERWRDYAPHLAPPWPGKLLSWTYSQPHTLQPITRRLFPQRGHKSTGDLWDYRKIVRADIYQPGHVPHEVTLLNWPMNDYFEHSVIDQPEEDVAVWLEDARQLSLSLLYWMQIEAPRPDGGQGHPGLYPSPNVVGTKDGLAMAPYFRESRRIKAIFTITEDHVGADARRANLKGDAALHAEVFPDTVGIGSYHIDLHPSTSGRNYIDIASLPFQIPLGALLPIRMKNLLPACKNIGTTHISNGCYRLHPVEWNIGESAGLLVAFCLNNHVQPRQVREQSKVLSEFQNTLKRQGVELEFPMS